MNDSIKFSQGSKSKVNAKNELKVCRVASLLRAHHFVGLTSVYTIAHEVGHVLGLGRSSEANAIMSYDHSPYDSTVQARLGNDDVDGISYLYPREEAGGGGGLAGCGPGANAAQVRIPKDQPIRFFGETLFLAMIIVAGSKFLNFIAREKM